MGTGCLVAVTGANACGKSTLLFAISGIIPEYLQATITGTISLNELDLLGIQLREMYHHLSFAMTDSEAQLMFPDIMSEIAFALENMGLPIDQIQHRVKSATQRFGIHHMLERSPKTLSGGEQRLVLFACLDALNSPLVLLDEPETGLSDKNIMVLCDWLSELKDKGRIVLIATHCRTLIDLCDHIVEL